MTVLVHGKHLQLLSLWGKLFLHITALLSITTLLFVALWEVVANTLWSSPALVSQIYPSTLVILQEQFGSGSHWASGFQHPQQWKRKWHKPLQYFCLGNPMDRGAGWATVQGVAEESGTTERVNNNNPQWKPRSLCVEDAGSVVLCPGCDFKPSHD